MKLTFKPNCDMCCDNFWIETDKPDEFGYTYVVSCPKCRGGRINRGRLKNSHERAGTPRRLQGVTINDFDWSLYHEDISTQKKISEQFIRQFREFQRCSMGLYIHSEVRGTGKSFLAGCLANSVLDKYGIDFRFVSTTALINIQKKDSELSKGGKRQIEMFCTIPLLILDDIGQRTSANTWLSDILFEIIDARYSNDLLTIYTSNVVKSKLDLDTRLIDRIYSGTVDLKLPNQPIRANMARDETKNFLRKIGIS